MLDHLNCPLSVVRRPLWILQGYRVRKGRTSVSTVRNGQRTTDDGLFGDEYLGPAQDELGLLAGPAVLALLGDAQAVHAFDALAADALVQGGGVRSADDGV